MSSSRPERIVIVGASLAALLALWVLAHLVITGVRRLPRARGLAWRHGVAALASVLTGVGNGDGTEGAWAGRVLGTYLHGPVLVRNPGLADLVLTWAAGRLPPLTDLEEHWTQQLRDQRLTAVAPAG